MSFYQAASPRPAPVAVASEPFARVVLRALRVHQWAKNALVFLPLVAAHRALEGPLAARAACAFASFCLCASSVYLLNDLCDLEADRRHPEKRLRPIASGRMSVEIAVVAVAVCLAGSAAASFFLPGDFRVALALYFAATAAYSLRLKRWLAVDVHVLAGLYTLRVIAGAAATGVSCSPWLLAFSMFFFLSLALLKRFIELADLAQRGGAAAPGRAYAPVDLGVLLAFGGASGMVSVLVLALYVSNAAVADLYGSPRLLWLVGCLLMIWLCRVWILASRGVVHHDPVLFALKDRASYAVGVAAAIVLAAASVRASPPPPPDAPAGAPPAGAATAPATP